MKSIKNFIKENFLYPIFLISFVAMLGSLYMSEIEKLPACPFCWWQRIWMYPIVIISLIAISAKDKLAKWHILALSGLGILFSLYQNLLQIGLFTESESCVIGGNSCASPTIFFELGNMGISLELMSLVSFITIFVLALSNIILNTISKEEK